jgi:hypothetical protein
MSHETKREENARARFENKKGDIGRKVLSLSDQKRLPFWCSEDTFRRWREDAFR